jgi:outer membrane protein assembly factor BamB
VSDAMSGRSARWSWLVIAGGFVACSGVPDYPVSERDAGRETETDMARDVDAGKPAAEPEPWRPFSRVLPTRSWLAHGDYSVFSSARAADLTGDGVLDVVVGHGLELSAHDGEAPVDPEEIRTLGSVAAYDGRSGERLWQFEAQQDMVGSAVFVELDGDDVLDVVIGGRYAELVALDGKHGALLWRFFSGGASAARAMGYHNFYSASVVDDHDGDGIADLVVANGGDATLGPTQPRPPGQLLALSGASGAVLGRIQMPDTRETYMSTTLIDGADPQLIFGSGGESWGGSLWRVPVSAVFASNATRVKRLASRDDTGFIAPAALADLSGDGVLDIVASAFGGYLVVIDGATDAVRFEAELQGVESHSTPILARVTADRVPDIAWSVNEGVWPAYRGGRYLLWDGASGELLMDERWGGFVPCGHVAADLDGDARDEILFGVNVVTGDRMKGELAFQLYLLDPLTLSAQPFGERFRRPAIATPWLGDLDADGELELIVASSYILSRAATYWLERYDLSAPLPATPFSGAYMGSAYDGRWDVAAIR